MKRNIHYEAAFEDFVRANGWPYLPVNESRRAIFSGSRVKSFDFLVHPTGRKPWLVDVKGRQFPYESPGGRRYWENWVSDADVEGLSRWSDVFGDAYDPVFVFAYALGSGVRQSPSQPHVFSCQAYSFVPVSAIEYAAAARRRSESWETVYVPTSRFRSLAKEFAAQGQAGEPCAPRFAAAL